MSVHGLPIVIELHAFFWANLNNPCIVDQNVDRSPSIDHRLNQSADLFV